MHRATLTLPQSPVSPQPAVRRPARRACGGHGYSLLSGLPTLFTHYVQNVTWEGDNNVMLLQVCYTFINLWPSL